MIKSFFGLDLKTSAKVILWATLVDNLILYVLSLVLMIQSKPIKNEKMSDDEMKTALSTIGCKLANDLKLFLKTSNYFFSNKSQHLKLRSSFFTRRCRTINFMFTFCE